ncbi:MAG: hypothetical protein LC676_06565 [Loktanella sp.]|nr:hypothetical protein [Loktanella sp.]
MALTAITAHDTVDYVSEMDPCKTTEEVPVDPKNPKKGKKSVDKVLPGATIFHLKPLDVYLKGHIHDHASTLSGRRGEDSVGIQTHVNKTNIEAVRHGLAGFDNFSDQTGTPIKFETQNTMLNGREYTVVADRVLNLLGIRLIMELADEIKNLSEVSAGDEKNSAPASLQ